MAKKEKKDLHVVFLDLENGRRTGSAEDHQRSCNCCQKKQSLAVAEAEGDCKGCKVT